MNCARCGTDVREEYTFCQACGTPTRGVPRPQEPPQQLPSSAAASDNREPQSRASDRQILIGFIAIVSALIGSVLVGLLVTEGDNATSGSDEFLLAVSGVLGTLLILYSLGAALAATVAFVRRR